MGEPRRPPRFLKVLNRLVRPLLLGGRGPAPQRLLVLRGRRTGAPRSTPVALLEHEGQRYIVAGYATADWVLNARRDPRGELIRGSAREPVRLVEVPSEQRPPILRAFLRSIPGGRRFLTVRIDATDQELAAAAAEHPVFLVTRLGDHGIT
jgi:deazaflavin-dependent oxidoreductase (nitroreductase family)